MLLRIISILLPVLSIVLIGYLYGRRHAPDMVTVNRINMGRVQKVSATVNR